MDLSLSRYLTPNHLGFFAALIMMATLSTSRALLSVGTGILLAAAVWQFAQYRTLPRQKEKRLVFLISMLFFLALCSVFYTSNMDSWKADIQSKLSLLVIPLSLSILPAFSKIQYRLLLWVFILVHVVIGLLSVVAYFQDFEAAIELVNKNSSIPVMARAGHIYFGQMLAFASLLAVHLSLQKANIFYKWESLILMVVGITGVVCIHLLTSRTGLLAFYGGAFGYLIAFVLRKKALRTGALVFILLLCMPLASYYAFPSFRNRVNITFWDLSVSSQKNPDLNHHSAGLRIIAWQASWEIFKANPVIGVGPADVGDELMDYYHQKKVNAKDELLLRSVHNQYLEQLTALGILGFMVLLMVLIYPLTSISKGSSLIIASFIALQAASMLTESFLERQIGIAFFCTLLMLLVRSPKGDDSQS